MYKQLLIDTLPAYSDINLSLLASNAKIERKRLEDILDPSNQESVTSGEYVAIAKSLPVCLSSCIKGFIDEIKELEYLDQQLSLVEQAADDDKVPLFSGMRRVLHRVIKAL